MNNIPSTGNNYTYFPQQNVSTPFENFRIPTIENKPIENNHFFKISQNKIPSESENFNREILDRIQMAKWIPNPGYTCYISSVVWPLFFLLNQEIRQKTEEFKKKHEHLKEDVLSKFKNTTLSEDQIFRMRTEASLWWLFSALRPNSKAMITTKVIEEFRQAIHKAYPTSFAYPGQREQEDAYDFLICLTDLWNWTSGEKREGKFYLSRTFTPLKNAILPHPSYDIDTALLPIRAEEPTHIINIRLSEKSGPLQKLSDLLVKIRQTEAERYVYLKKDEEEQQEIAKPFLLKVDSKEQFIVESRETAPEIFIGCLSRFGTEKGGLEVKRFDSVIPDASLEFSTFDGNETVSYDLVAITLHSGESIAQGHYYSFVRVKKGNKLSFFEYNDQKDISECDDEAVIKTASSEGYIFYYKKRAKDSPKPDPLPETISSKPEDTNQRLDVSSFQDEIIEEKNHENSFFMESMHSPIDFFNSNSFMSEVSPVINDHLFYENSNHNNINEFEELNLREGKISPKKRKKSEGNREDAKKWIDKHSNVKFSAGDKASSLLEFFSSNPNLQDLMGFLTESSEEEALFLIAETLQRGIYLIDPIDDKELMVLEDGHPLPGNRFRFGEEYNAPVLYLFRCPDKSYVEINR